jgi:hypothetical protein
LLPTLVNALLSELAKVFIPATAAKATKAMTNTLASLILVKLSG